MLTYSSNCRVAAATTFGLVDITDQVQEVVASCGVLDGRVTIVRPDDGCALVVNEQERGLHADVQATIQRLFSNNGSGPPPVGCASLVLPIVGGRVHLGTWQRILMVELAEPQDRSLLVQVVGE